MPRPILLSGFLLMLALAATGSGAQEAPVRIAIDPQQRRDVIRPFVYGQFIEHLGRCVYGGIWAEMLEDRKFYHPITDDYAPYTSLQDTPFPVVGASPWQIVGPAGSIRMDPTDPFVGDHTPVVRGGSAIQQRDLALVKGRSYLGYLWCRGQGNVEVSIRSEEPRPSETTCLKTLASDDYRKHKFRFTATESSDHAILRVEVGGDGEVHVGTLSLMPADNVRGMRADTLAQLKRLNAPMYRWPGGNFVSGYEWRDGVGPRDRRPPRKNPAWTGVEHNDVGIDEFLDFCSELEAEPLIAVNTGYGDAHSAAAEVEYCNAIASTYGGGLRAKYGRAQPYGVKYWCVGNEMFGSWQAGYMQLAQYTVKHTMCVQAMRKADPTIQLIGVGELEGLDPTHDPDRKLGWSETMLRDCADQMDLISEHFYVGRTPWAEGPGPKTVAEHIEPMRAAIRKKAEGHRKVQDHLGLVGDKRVPIAMDEWNYWHREYKYGELGCPYDLADALGVAAGLHEYFRHTDIIHMAHYAQTVNVIGCIKTTKTEAFMDTTGLPLMLYRAHFGVTPVEVKIDGQGRDLDVVAALSADGDLLTLAVINPRPKPATLRIEVAGQPLQGAGEQWLVAGADPRATNGVGETKVAVQHGTVDGLESWTSPGYSFAIVRLPVDRP